MIEIAGGILLAILILPFIAIILIFIAPILLGIMFLEMIACGLLSECREIFFLGIDFGFFQSPMFWLKLVVGIIVVWKLLGVIVEIENNKSPK